MASLQTRLGALITTIKTETKTLRTLISGTNNGDTTALQTTATNLVDAINEVKGLAGASAVIDDTAASTSKTYSSTKIDATITAAIASALEGEDLSDIAAAIAANAAAHSDLATAAQFNTLSALVAKKANASDVYTQSELGNPDTDLVATWNAA